MKIIDLMPNVMTLFAMIQIWDCKENGCQSFLQFTLIPKTVFNLASLSTCILNWNKVTNMSYTIFLSTDKQYQIHDIYIWLSLYTVHDHFTQPDIGCDTMAHLTNCEGDRWCCHRNDVEAFLLLVRTVVKSCRCRQAYFLRCELKQYIFVISHIWNLLPPDLQAEKALNMFKKILKSWDGPAYQCN